MKRHTNIAETPIWNFLTKVVDCVILGFWWLVASLPVITVGASCAALYNSIHKAIYLDEGRPTKVFWSSFVSNLKQGMLVTAILLLCTAFAVFIWFFAGYVGKDTAFGTFYRIFSILVGVLIVTVSAYAFPIMSRYLIKTKDLLIASVAVSVTRFPFTFILLVITLVCIAGVMLVPVTIVILPSLYMLSAERLLEPAMKKLTGQQHLDNREA